MSVLFLSRGHAACLLLLVGVLLGLHQPNVVAQDDDDELVPGLLAKFTGGGRTSERVVESLSFDWDKLAPDSRLASGPFSAEFSGQLLVQHEGATQWFVYGQGAVEIEVAGQKVLSGKLDQLGWLKGSDATSHIGVQPFKVRFERTSDRAELHVFWASESFGIEPLPVHLLLHDQPRLDLQLAERGRRLFAAYRCGQCHSADPHEVRLNSPDLRFVSVLDAEWLKRQLAGQHGNAARLSERQGASRRSDVKESPAAEGRGAEEPAASALRLTNSAGRMPSFGLNDAEVADLVAFLSSKSQSPKLDALPKPDKKRTDELDRADGLVLLKSTGCLACHVVNDVGMRGEFGGADLSAAAGKRSTEWFFAWLAEPERLNPQHRMPTFKLSVQERRQLALALSSLKPKDAAASANDTKKGVARRGADIVNDARCLACHNLPGTDKPVLGSIPPLTQPVKDWEQSCLAPTASRAKWRPTFPRPTDDERAALKAYVGSLTQQSSPQSLAERGRAVLEAKNCLACHPRGTNKGLASIAKSILASEPSLAAFGPALIPPNLSAVGDKLHDDALKQAISGESQVRKSWLKVRMPKFEFSDNEKSALAAYFIGHDRIPESSSRVAPQLGGESRSDSPTKAQAPVDDQTLLLGQTLVGPKGFSCIACHQMGSYVPKNTAIGTRGSDLLALRSRVREPFFHRWVHAPLRVVPGMEMPSYGTRPVKGVLDDNPQRQFETLWRTLNDPRFQPPTDIGSVEQFVYVEPNQPARIVRDVFTNSEANGGGYIPRAFAVGLNNQHNLLYDLDSLTVRSWTFGDLARQRTVGKSWYWDLAGSAIVPAFSRESDYLLLDQNAANAQPFGPTKTNGTVGKLVSYRPYQSGVEFVFDLNFTLNGIANSVRVREQLLPRGVADTTSTRAGLERHITVSSIPTGFEFVIARPKLNANDAKQLGRPTIRRADDAEAKWRDAPVATNAASGPHREVSRVTTNDGSASVTLLYEASLSAPALGVLPKPEIKGSLQKIESMPGFEGVQLPLLGSIMPTAMTFLPDGTLAFVSLKGHVYLARDTDKDGLPDSLQLFEEGLAAPYGIIADGDSLLVAHKPELLRLRDTDGDGRADERTVFASGWGFNDNYHDWTCGIVRDASGNLFVGTGSDYSQPGRPKEVSRWRGKILKISPTGEVQPFAHAFRYPTGLAMDAQGRLFASDNQGEQNCFNEINHIRDGQRYGVESLHERQPPVDPGQKPAMQVPHPYTRSVNGLAIIPETVTGPTSAWAGHGLSAEYNNRFLVRFTYHEVDGVVQGAVFPFSKPNFAAVEKSFLGPLSVAVSPTGEIFVGSIHDSGWLGGLNVGSIVKLKATSVPPGLKDIKATRDGFELSFFKPVDSTLGSDAKNYSISGYTRVWQGTYETPDSGRYQPPIDGVTISTDGLTARLKIERLKPDFVYEINCPAVFASSDAWPTIGSYTLHRIPK